MSQSRVRIPRSRRIHKTVAIAVAALCVGISTASSAQDASNSAFKLTGFISLVGGQVLDGNLNADYAGFDPINGVACPCYIADWSNAGVYNKNFSLTPESRAGVQVSYALTPQAKVVGQVVVRGTNGTPDITWAYASYKLNKDFELQVGRKRVPLYYYSDFQDIGVAYPWVATPPELYGWDATNYNGVSVRYGGSFGDTNVTASLFGGREDFDKSLYWRLYGLENTKVTWKNILGADLEVNNGPWTIRGVYMGADVETDGVLAKLTAYGLAANLDMDTWFVLSEVTSLKRESAILGLNYSAPAATLGVGLRLGKWTPFVNWAQYVESAGDAVYAPATFRRTSATLRYDLNSSSALKVQVDRHKDATQNLGGDVTVLRLSYDRVF